MQRFLSTIGKRISRSKPKEKIVAVETSKQKLKLFEESIPSRYKLEEVETEKPESQEQFSNITTSLQDALSEFRIRKPTEIQTKGIEAILENKNVLLASQTGSGKTLAYLLPIFKKLKEEEKTERRILKSPRAVVLVPTRELVMQVHNVAKLLSHHEKLRVDLVLQGMTNEEWKRKFNSPIDLLITIPYRFQTLVATKTIDTKAVRHLVLDESDTLLAKDFAPQCLDIYKSVQSQLNSLVLVAATLPKSILKEIAQVFSSNCHKISMGIKQTFRPVKEGGNGKAMLVKSLLEENPESTFLIFGNTKGSIAQLHEYLVEFFPKAQLLHRDLPDQSRAKIVELFKKDEFNVLITTDLISRGVDTINVDHVILYDFPRNMIDYLHRVGRTGRAGNPGKVTAIYTRKDGEFVNYVKNKYISQRLRHRGKSLIQIKKPSKRVSRRLERQKNSSKQRSAKTEKIKMRQPARKLARNNQ